MNSTNFFTGVLVGAIAGLTVGLLFAPEKGSDTRKKLLDKGNDLANTLKEKFNDIMGSAGLDGKAEDLAITAKRKGKDMMDKAENKVEEWQDKVS